MDKLDMESVDVVDENIEKIGNLFPDVIVESENGKSIDFDLLKQELSKDIVEGNKEKYQLTWPGKKEAILTANTPTKNTLRPLREKSVDFDNTQNIYIEGDNLEALKILQESYLNKVKCIYIDPPYNTGNDFIYNDNFNKDSNSELEVSGQVDTDGNRLVSNSQSNGRFHSDWLSMMYPRLKLARNLLSKDGVIFISIDDNEQANLKKICDEIFGERNFICNICHKNRDGVSNDKIISSNHNLILFYCKDYETIHSERSEYGIVRDEKEDFKNYNKNDNDGKGYYTLNPVTGPGGAMKGNPYYEIMGISNYWRFSKERMEKMIKEGIVVKVGNNIYQKTYKEDMLGKKKGATTWWDNVGTTAQGTADLKKIFPFVAFDYSKPVSLITYILKYIKNDKESIILDFFSGSATTAHGVMKLNAEDNGKRRYIMVQINEKCDERSEAYKNGYKTICEIGEERIRKAAKKIKEETNADIDYGFRVYKLDSSNMNDVYYKPNEISQGQLDMFELNIKEDRSTEDILTQVILDLGLTLDLKIEEKNILNNKVYFVDENSLIACFDDKIDINIVDEICKYRPWKVVFKDSSFKYDNDKINLYEKIKKLSPETEVNIL